MVDSDDPQALEDSEANREDFAKIESTDKATTAEDGEQPPAVPPWNDDEGQVVPL